MIYNKHGNLVRFIYLAFACVWFVLTCGGRLTGKTRVVLCYHGILPNQKERFQWQMARIAVPATFAENKKYDLRYHDKRYPKVCITFDDAFENLWENALPILEQFRIPAVIFAVAGNLGEKPCWKMPTHHPESGENTMKAYQLASLNKRPLFKIGSHTVTHPNLVEISPEQALTELTDSKQQLERLLGCSVEEFALPHGAYNEAVLAMAQEAGYKRIYTLDPKTIDLESDVAIIGRFSMSPDIWKIEFILTCAGAYAWLRPWRGLIRQVRGLIWRFRN